MQQNSGDVTPPVSRAPPAPSMVPQKRAPISGGERGVASIRQTIKKKQTAPGVGSENVAVASIRAKQIVFDRSLKTSNEQMDAVQEEQKEAAAQREKSERDLKARLEQIEQAHAKLAPQQAKAKMDLLAKLLQLQTELETEKKQRLSMEERLKALEEKQVEPQTASANSDISTQVSELARKVELLEDHAKRIAKLENFQVNMPQHEGSVKGWFIQELKPIRDQLAGLKNEIASTVEKSNKDQIGSLEESNKAVMQQCTTNLEELKKSLEILQQADLVQKTSVLESDLASVKGANVKELKEAKDDISKQLNAHMTDMVKSTESVKRDIEKDIAEIRKEVEQNGLTLSSLPSFTSTSNEQLQKDFASKLATAVEGIQSDISELQIDRQDKESAFSSDINRLKQEVARLQRLPSASTTPGSRDESGASATEISSTKKTLDELDDRLTKVERTASDAHEDAKHATDFTLQACGGLEKLEKELSALQEIVKTLQAEATNVHERPSYNDHRTGSALMALSSLSRDSEGTANVREDTHDANPAVESRLGSLEHGLRNLTSRYDNITTDHLYQSMVQWLQAHYPSAPDFLAAFRKLDAQLEKIDGVANKMTWLTATPGLSEKLLSLTQNFDAIQELISADKPTDVSAELKSLRELIDTEIRTRTEEIERVRQGTVNSLASTNKALNACTAKVAGLEEDVKSNSTDLGAAIEKWETKCKEFEAEVKASKLLGNSVKTMNELIKDLSSRQRGVETMTTEQQRKLVAHQTSLGK